MPDSEVTLVRYVFLDVVGFTHQRSVEAQADVVAALNSIVQGAAAGIKCDELLYLPTGDGICICIAGRSPFDSHIQLALLILRKIYERNNGTTDSMRRFSVRIGINENSDNIVEDINGRRNVAGTGINVASRVMKLSDANQIMVSSTTHEVLSTRERYLGSFRPYGATIKHGHRITVYQYIAQGVEGLDISPPSVFQPKPVEQRRLTEFEAYYIGYGLKLRPLFLRKIGMGIDSYAAIILLWFLANDAVGIAHQTEIEPYKQRVFGEGSASFEESLDYYMSLNFWLICEFAAMIEKTLWHLSPLFEMKSGLSRGEFPNQKASQRLRIEHPGVVARLGLDTAKSE